MKIIDGKGKLFNKIHIFDLILILLAIIVLLTGYSRLSGDSIINFSGTSQVKLRYTVETYPYREAYFENLEVGDKLAEDKKYLAGEIVGVEVVDYYMTSVDNNGDVVTDINPLKSQAFVTIEATVDYGNPIYSFGSQELREGSPYFLVTDKCNLSAIITSIEVIE
jgi:hypothetical protein